MKKVFFVLLMFTFTPFVFSQNSITGTVFNNTNKKTIEAATVFVLNTTLGVVTDESGKFELKDVPKGKIELVVSFLGFEKEVRSLTIVEGKKTALKIYLKPSTIDLSTIEIVSIKEKKRKRFLKQFKTAFFGETRNADACTLLNPEVLIFNGISNTNFTVKADQLLEIENRATGYIVYFLLEHFEKKGQKISYSGKPYFKPMVAKTTDEEKRWAKNRQETYLGSKRHFVKALYDNELRKEGFLIRLANLNGEGKFVEVGNIRRNDLVKEGGTIGEQNIQLQSFLKVIYTKEKDDIQQMALGSPSSEMAKLGQKAEQDMITQESSFFRTKSQPQVSYLFARKNIVVFQKNGYFVRPELIVDYGYWSYEGIGDLLPMEYGLPVLKTKKKREPDAFLNGFSLSNSKIPIAEIRKGGPPRDGIPSIDHPKFIASEEVLFLEEHDRVLGVVVNGIGKAYPIKILNLHEVVNDRFGTEAIVVTYCPLCGSGMAFRSTINGKLTSFGVSGLLYNSDVLLYDRTTESLWSQIMGRAVTGKAAGTKLEYVQTTATTWGKWKEEHPKTVVLSTETGYQKNYERKAYQGYEETEKLMFPVVKTSTELSNKTKIIGIEINGKFKAYPLYRLKKNNGVTKDEFQGKELTIYYDKKSKTAKITDKKGKELDSVVMYWFAWYAFHSETAVFK